MANAFTYRAAPGRYHCGPDLTNLRVTLFYGPSNELLACAYCCYMNIDFDGDPQAYGPLNTPGIEPEDSLGSAGWLAPADNATRKGAYDAGIDTARKEYEDLLGEVAALDPKTPKGDRDALNEKFKKARARIYELNRYLFKDARVWHSSLWQDGDADKPPRLGEVFWDWYGLQSMTPAVATTTHATDPTTKATKKPMLYHPSFMHSPGPINYEAYEDVYGRFPVVQVAPEPGPGYFVSQISPIPGRVRVNPAFQEWDQRCTLQPGTTQIQAYGALSTQLESAANLAMGDTVLAMHVNTGRTSAFPFVDRGYGNGVAECSPTAYTDLGGTFKHRPGGKLYKDDHPEMRFLYLACAGGRQPADVLRRIAACDNSEDFPTILAFIVKATAAVTYGAVSTDPLQDYEQWKRLPDDRRFKPDVIDYAAAIDVALRDNGFHP